MVVLSIDNTSFDGSFLKLYQNDIVIILFKAKWCKFCVDFEPLYNTLSTKYRLDIIFTSIDVDDNTELISELNLHPFGFNIKTYPTIVVYKQGVYLSTYIGNRNKDDMELFLSHIINNNNTKKIGGKSINDKVKVAIIVPYFDIDINQNRYDQLQTFYPYMYEFLTKQKLYDFHIYIMEQYNNNKNMFNRGKLLNCGFDLVNKNEYNTIIFHDVDLLPNDNLSKYYAQYPTNPIHIAHVWDRYNDNPKYFGGIVSFNVADFTKINGFPNNFWKWGGEDDSLYNRIKKNNITISLPSSGSITDLEKMDINEKMNYLKKNKLKNLKKWELLAEDKYNWKNNGLNNLSYKVIKNIELTNYCTKITVDINL